MPQLINTLSQLGTYNISSATVNDRHKLVHIINICNRPSSGLTRIGCGQKNLNLMESTGSMLFL